MKIGGYLLINIFYDVIVTSVSLTTCCLIDSRNIGECSYYQDMAFPDFASIQVTDGKLSILGEQIKMNLSQMPDCKPVTDDRINPVVALSIYCQKNKLPLPVFTIVEQSGPKHSIFFRTRCKVKDIIKEGCGFSKSYARIKAAKYVLAELNRKYDANMPPVFKPKRIIEVHCPCDYCRSVINNQLSDVVQNQFSTSNSADRQVNSEDVDSSYHSVPMNVTNGGVLQPKETTKNELHTSASTSGSDSFNAIYHLNAYCQMRKLPPPVYTIVEQSGPCHSPVFRTTCKVEDIIKEGCGSRKSEARLEAAKLVLEDLKERHGINLYKQEEEKKFKGTENKSKGSNLEDVEPLVKLYNMASSKNVVVRYLYNTSDDGGFKVRCQLGDIVHYGVGSSKKKAKQDVAKKMILDFDMIVATMKAQRHDMT